MIATVPKVLRRPMVFARRTREVPCGCGSFKHDQSKPRTNPAVLELTQKKWSWHPRVEFEQKAFLLPQHLSFMSSKTQCVSLWKHTVLSMIQHTARLIPKLLRLVRVLDRPDHTLPFVGNQDFFMT
jgi:hypothetical protein